MPNQVCHSTLVLFSSQHRIFVVRKFLILTRPWEKRHLKRPNKEKNSVQFLHKRLLTLDLCVKHVYRCFAAFPGIDKSEQFFRVKRVWCTSPKRTEVSCAQRSHRRFWRVLRCCHHTMRSTLLFFNFSYLFSEHLCTLVPILPLEFLKINDFAFETVAKCTAVSHRLQQGSFGSFAPFNFNQLWTSLVKSQTTWNWLQFAFCLSWNDVWNNSDAWRVIDTSHLDIFYGLKHHGLTI